MPEIDHVAQLKGALMSKIPGKTRQHAKGGALLGALFFMVAVTAGGMALLESSTLNQLAIIERSVDVRLMIAAEAGLETVRGRFRFVAGVQDDWDKLVPSTSWTKVDTMTINGIAVQVYTREVSNTSMGKAEVRATASARNHSRNVQLTLRVPSFSDYSVFLGNSRERTPAPGFMYIGDFYTGGDLNIIRSPLLFGKSFLGGIPTSGSRDSGSPAASGQVDISFVYGPPATNVDQVLVPPSVHGQDILENEAKARSAHMYKNTYKIELRGNEFVRHYYWKSTTSPTSGVTTQVLPIPANGVIYVSSEKCPANWSLAGAAIPDNNTGSVYDADKKRYNNHWDTNPSGQHPTWYNPPNVSSKNRVNLDLSGWLAKGIRVTVACEHQVTIVNNLIYETNAENPNLRRASQRESSQALAMTEMLGVYAREWVLLGTSFDNMVNETQDKVDSDGIASSSNTSIGTFAGPIYEGPDGISYAPPGKPNSRTNAYARKQHVIDASVMSGGYVVRYEDWTSRSRRKITFCGGIISAGTDRNGSSRPGLDAQYEIMSFVYDYRLKNSTPPFFLTAYNTSAKMVSGSWKSWKS